MTHTLRYYGLPGGRVRVICDVCKPRWARTFDPGHTTEDWQELSRQHSGRLRLPPAQPNSVASRHEPR